MRAKTRDLAESLEVHLPIVEYSGKYRESLKYSARPTASSMQQEQKVLSKGIMNAL